MPSFSQDPVQIRQSKKVDGDLQQKSGHLHFRQALLARRRSTAASLIHSDGLSDRKPMVLHLQMYIRREAFLHAVSQLTLIIRKPMSACIGGCPIYMEMFAGWNYLSERQPDESIHQHTSRTTTPRQQCLYSPPTTHHHHPDFFWSECPLGTCSETAGCQVAVNSSSTSRSYGSFGTIVQMITASRQVRQRLEAEREDCTTASGKCMVIASLAASD